MNNRFLSGHHCKPTRIALAILLAMLPLAQVAFGATVNTVSTDDNSYHVFPPNAPFSFTLTYSGSGVTGYQWVDWQGNDIGPAVTVSGTSFTVNSPSGVSISPGYYGLQLLPAGTVIADGQRKELGFAVLPAITGGTPSTLPYGMVHADIADPYLGYAWTKTLWAPQAWNGTSIDATGWQNLIQNVSNHGRTETPIMTNTPWTDSPNNISGISSMASAFYQATPNVPVWEWGIEENWNVPADYNSALNWYNNTIAPKFQAVRQQANLYCPTVQNVEQVVGTWTVYEQAFFSSNALPYVDILSIHPYPWPDFQTPDNWLDSMMDSVNGYKAASAKPNMPIFFTEIGCVINDAGVSQMYEGTSPITGLSRADAAKFLLKIYAKGFTKGVSRIYFYHYSDWDAQVDQGESHFGIKDYWGYPKPSYVAYAAFANSVGGRSAQGKTALANNVYSYKFADSTSACYVVWAYPTPSSPVSVPLSSITSGLPITSVVNSVGTPISYTAGGSISVDDSPVFVSVLLQTPPNAPTGLTAVAGNKQVSLSWASTNKATSYNVYRGTTAGGEATAPVASGISTTNYTDTGLTNGTTYYYKVAAVGSGGTSPLSVEASAMPTGTPTPTGIGTSPGNGLVAITWLAASGATSYSLYRGTAPGAESSTPIATGVPGTSLVNSGLTNGKTYYYQVAAVGASGQSARSAEVLAIPQATAAGSASARIALQNSASNQVAIFTISNKRVTATATVSTTPAAGWKVAGFADFNNDGQPDLLFQNQTTGALTGWLMNGNSILGGASFSSPGTSWKVTALGDFNGDGHPDLLLQNKSNGSLEIIFLNGTHVVNTAAISTAIASGWHVAGAADFNNDLRADILLQNSNGKLFVWYMKEATVTGGVTIAAAPASAWLASAVVAYKGTTQTDIVFQQGGQLLDWDFGGIQQTGSGPIATSVASGWSVVAPR